MFIGVYEENKKTFYNIYYKNSGGYQAWNTDTFSPTCRIIGTLDFKVKGTSYEEKKNNARDLAVDYQLNFSQYSWSYGELFEIENFFETIGKRYGLLKEFRENCIC